jgi:hypothetical protein
MEWTNDATLRLISECQKRVVLWDRTHKFYKLVNKKNDAWEEIAKEVGISVPEVKKKIIMVEIDSFDILTKRLRLVNESPGARNRIVRAIRSATGIAFRNDVSFLIIRGPTKLTSASKSE